MKLLTKQEHALYYLNDKTTTEILYGGGAGGGKSAFIAFRLIELCQKYKGSRWLLGRSKLKTLKDTTLKSFFEISSKLGVSEQWNYNAQSNTITWTNGSEIVLKDLFLYPSDPEFDELGSLEITGSFIDEVNQITVKARNVVKSRIRYKLDEFGLIPKQFMTCNPAKTWVYSDFYKPYKDGTLKPYRKFIQSLLSDNPNVTEHYKSNLLTLDENSKQRLLYGNWEYDNDPAKLIEYNSILDLWTNSIVKDTTKYITADIARMGSDKAVIIAWEGLTELETFVFAKSKLTEIQDKILEFKSKYSVQHSKIIADEDGVGGGVVDFMGIKGFVNGSRPIANENYQNLKTQCYYKLAELINKGEIRLTSDDNRELIVQELEQIKRDKIDSDGKLQLMAKDKVKELIGRSPDFSDALMMRMYFELNKSSGEYYY
tara:strand:- start:12 stop:1298 length:1287 start_codon:yes stop_codon:yes gene_type:complete